MNSDLVDFANYLRRTHALAQPAKEGADTAASQAEGALRKLWDMTELSAGDFADKVCSFFKLPRATLQELLAAPPLVKPFSRRFLRATSVFPHEAAEGRPALAVADPSDLAAVRAAEIVLGGKIAVRVASFEDIATILDHRLGEEEAGLATQERAVAPREDDAVAAASPRHDRRHRADRKRQDDHACDNACGAQPADPQDSHH